MAAVYQRPTSVLSDTQTTQTIPQRRRRESIEVIDVDSLDDDLHQHHRQPTPGPSRPAQRRRLSTTSEVISLLDSDDDDEEVNSNQRPAQSRLRSPPLRNRPLPYVPPVPPIPGQYAGQSSFPMRRHPPPYQAPPPIVRPNDQPFPFEANLQRQRQRGPTPGSSNHGHNHNNVHLLPPRPFQAAPPSHHVPALGLGGALIAQNRARYNQAGFFGRLGILGGMNRIIGDIGQEEAPRRGTLNYFSLGNFGLFNNNNQMEEDEDDQDRLLALRLFAEDGGFRDLDPAYNPARAYIRSEYLRRRSANEEPAYKPEYTHPKVPEPGFGYDFAPKPPPEVIDILTSPSIRHKKLPKSSQDEPIIIDDDDDDNHHSSYSVPSSPLAVEPSASAKKSHIPFPESPTTPTNQIILACARCLDPLVLGAKLTLEEQKNRRIWGLQCGHLIDGKCLKELGQPKERYIFSDAATTATATTTATPIIDRKGKGKARDIDIANLTISEGNHEYVNPNPNPQPPPQPQQPINDNSNSGSGPTSIRSRLRSSRVQTQVPKPSIVTTPTTPTSASSSSSSYTPSTRKRNKTGKSKKQQEQSILMGIGPPPEFIWYCPVNGCGKAHRSIEINNEWVPYRDDGDYGISSSSNNGNNGSGRGRGRGGRGGRGRGVRGRSGRGGIRGRGDVGMRLVVDPDGPKGVIPLFL